MPMVPRFLIPVYFSVRFCSVYFGTEVVSMQKSDKRDKVVKLDQEHPYGNAHPLIGKACLYDGRYAIPYGTYEVEGETLLAIIFHDDNATTSMSGIKEDELYPIDPSSI